MLHYWLEEQAEEKVASAPWFHVQFLGSTTVDRWWQSSGQHAQQIHQVLVQRPLDLLQV